MRVKEIMTTDVEAIDSNATLQTLAERMKELDVGDMPVKVDGDVVGMVTDRDIVVRAVSHGLDPKVASIVDAMTEGVVTCNENDDVNDAALKMGKAKVRRLLVKNDENRIHGIISLGDVARNIDPSRSGEVLAQISG